jgi:hypothetical protein
MNTKSTYAHVWCFAQDVATREPIMVSELFATFRDCTKRSNEVSRHLRTMEIETAKKHGDIRYASLF